MARLQLKPLENYRFCTELTVRTTDLNYGGHLGNDRLLSLVHEARVAWLADHGWTELESAGTSLIMGDAALVYQGEAFAGDRLTFEVDIAEPTRSGFRLFFRVTRRDGADTHPIALAETGMVCFDYHVRRISALPPLLASACEDTNHG